MALSGVKVVFVSSIVCLLSSYSYQSIINSEFKTELNSNGRSTDLKSYPVDTNPESENKDVSRENNDKENKDHSSEKDIPVNKPTIPEEHEGVQADSAAIDKSNTDKTDIDTKQNEEGDLSDLEPTIKYSDSQREPTDQIEENPDSQQTHVDKEESLSNSEQEVDDRKDKVKTPDFPTTLEPEEPEEPEQIVEDKTESEDDREGPQDTIKSDGIVDTSVRELDPVELTPEDEDMVIMKMRELGGILDEKEIADIIEQEQTVEDMEGDLPEETEELRFEPIPMPTDFESYDRNGDGFIEMEELTDVTGAFENVADAFIVCDKNGDGFIDEEEFKAAPWDLSGKPPEVVEEQA